MIRAADLRLLLIAVVLFGGAWPITKSALVDATPLWFALGRAGFAALVAAAALLALGRLALPSRQDWPVVAAVGILQLGGFFALSHLAVALVPAGRTALISNVTIFWLVPLSVFVLGERVSPRRWLAAGIGLAGIAALAGPWAIDWSSHDAILGHAMLLGAGLLWSIAIIATRLFPPRRSMFELLPWCFAVGACVLLPLALWREPQGGVGMGGLWQLLFIGFVAAPLGTWSIIEAGRRLPGVVASLGILLVPAFGIIISALWLHEPITPDIILGGILIAASVAIAVRE